MERTLKKKIVVIGAVNMDIGGTPREALIDRDSNPGTVTLRPGGVGRNIAHDLCLLGAEVSLIAAVGGDVYGAAILESCRSIGIDMSMSLVLPERRSSTYLYVNDASGDMHIAISDMEIALCVTPEYLAPLMEEINRADAVVLDANLTAETIAFVCEHCTVPVYADPVSTVKAEKLRPVLHRLFCLKPNAIEAEKLSGESEPARAAAALNALVVNRVYISCGGDGMYAAEEGKLLRLPAERINVVNTTGAGDAATAAIVFAGVNGLGLEEAAALGMKAGALTCTCVEANNPELASLSEGLGSTGV